MVDAAGQPAVPTMTPRGGSLFGLPVTVSDAVAEARVMLGAAQIAAWSDRVLLDASSETSLNMDSTLVAGAAATTSCDS